MGLGVLGFVAVLRVCVDVGLWVCFKGVTVPKKKKTKILNERIAVQAYDKYLKEWMAGEFLALGEYRMSKAEVINWRDKTTGRAMSAPMLRHTVEFGSLSVQVS